MILLALSVSPILCALGVVQILGLAAAAGARMVEGTRYERGGQWICLAAMAMVGGVCFLALRLGPDSVAACAVTLTLMTLIAVMDFR
jgi:hypothetical protein